MIDVKAAKLAITDEVLDENLTIQVVDEIYMEPITGKYLIGFENVFYPSYAEDCSLIEK